MVQRLCNKISLECRTRHYILAIAGKLQRDTDIGRCLIMVADMLNEEGIQKE